MQALNIEKNSFCRHLKIQMFKERPFSARKTVLESLHSTDSDIWSIDLEKQLDELLSRKKQERKKKVRSRLAEELRCTSQDWLTDRAQDQPDLKDILPLKPTIWNGME